MSMRQGGFDQTSEKLKKLQQAKRYGIDSRQRLEAMRTSWDRSLKSASVSTLVQQRDHINAELDDRRWGHQLGKSEEIIDFVANVVKQHKGAEYQRLCANEHSNIDSIMSILKGRQ